MSRNRFGIHAGVWGFDGTSQAVAFVIRQAGEIGYDIVEIPAVDRDAVDVSAIRRAADVQGIEPFVSLALSFDDDITDADPERSARGERRLLDAVEFAADIGAPFVGGVIFSAMGRYTRLPSRRAREDSLAVLRRVAAHAARRDVTLGVEYVNRYESNLLNTAAQTARFLDDLDAPNVVLHLDTFHAAIEESSLRSAIADAGPRLGYIHASESHRGRLGTGSIDWDVLARDLADADYRGPITVETFSRDVIGDDAAIDIGLWRALWTDPAELAADSLSYLRARFAVALPA